MKRLIGILLLISQAVMLSAADIKIYVSPDGDDNGDGSISNPVADRK